MTSHVQNGRHGTISLHIFKLNVIYLLMNLHLWTSWASSIFHLHAFYVINSLLWNYFSNCWLKPWVCTDFQNIQSQMWTESVPSLKINVNLGCLQAWASIYNIVRFGHNFSFENLLILSNLHYCYYTLKLTDLKLVFIKLASC